jgi:hypothetical protein
MYRNTWLTVSATECAPYASRAELPDINPATNLAIAIQKLATKAAMMALFVPWYPLLLSGIRFLVLGLLHRCRFIRP